MHSSTREYADNEEEQAMRTITIELPDTITINGAKDAPEALRTVSTEKWGPEFVLVALAHGVSQKLGDTWSVSKKDEAKTRETHAVIESGDWTSRAPADPMAKAKKAAGGLTEEQKRKLIAELQVAMDKGEEQQKVTHRELGEGS